MKLSACALTDVGLLRKNNEDAVFADCRHKLFIVADGMGGHLAGDVASSMAVEIICSQLPPATPPPQNIEIHLKEAFILTSQQILQIAKSDPAKRGMGTTLSVLYIDGDMAQLAHVGDSRIYRLRKAELEQLSIDHSLVAEQERMGLISAKEARRSQMRNILLQAVGLEDKVDVFLRRELLQKNDLFLLCSDGLTEMLNDIQICHIMNQKSSLEQLAQHLVEEAKNAGGRDNISVVMIKIEG